MTPLVLVATVIAGSLGAVMRLIILDSLRDHTSRLVAVLVVNILGSALAGGILALPQTTLTAVLVVGLAGGLTTFSTVAVLLVPSPRSPRVVLLLGHALVQSGAAVAAAWSAFQIVALVA
jgi:fluoride ion exporter CrcB/FEX